MSIRLNWINPNTTFDKINIYKSETKFTKDVLPSVFKELVTGNTYLDETTKLDTLYWYAVGVVSKGDEVVSMLPPAIQRSSLGPGPKTILRGNDERGYFGVVTETEFFTGLQVNVAIGGSYNPGTTAWHKFSYDGRILYFPSKPLNITLNWNNIYSVGAVFGMDNTGVGNHGLTPVNQLKIISKGDDDFIIRLPRLTTRPDYTPIAVNTATVSNLHNDVYNSEWVQCMASLFGNTRITPTPGKIHPFDVLVANTTDWPDSGAGYYLMAAEYSGANAMTSLGVVNIYNGVGSSARNNSTAWRPVLELKPLVTA